MVLKSSFVFTSVVSVCGLVAGGASATVLTFDVGAVFNGQDINNGYGDDVEALTEGTFGYGEAGEGFTPNVQVDYPTDTGADPNLWTFGYGSLQNVLYDENDGNGMLRVVLTADAGFVVNLYGFDMAEFGTTGQVINSVFVQDAGGNDLFRETNVVFEGATTTVFDFSAAPLTSSTLTIGFDSSNLGGGSDNIGFDNIRFGQDVPEPGSLALLGLGGVALLRRRR